ncbi:hypothetical protein ACJX0J_038601, partial [Zea mays]
GTLIHISEVSNKLRDRATRSSKVHEEQRESLAAPASAFVDLETLYSLKILNPGDMVLDMFKKNILIGTYDKIFLTLVRGYWFFTAVEARSEKLLKMCHTRMPTGTQILLVTFFNFAYSLSIWCVFRSFNALFFLLKFSCCQMIYGLPNEAMLTNGLLTVPILL